MTPDFIKKLLRDLLHEAKIDLADAQIETLLQYADMLKRWNKVYNLTAIYQPEKIISHHLLDSLVVSPYLHGNDIIDVGTGAGLPGIPLAIANPAKKFTLLDSNQKKMSFVRV